MFDWITIGDCTIDNFLILDDREIGVACDTKDQHCKLCLTFADKIPVREIHQLVAGNASNNAVGASRLGLKTAIYTVIGDDAGGQKIREEFEAQGVQTDYVITEQGTPSNLHTVLSFHGERTILIHHVSRRYKLPKMSAAKWVYFTSMADGFETILPDLKHYLETNHAKLVYQPGTFQLRAGPHVVGGILRLTDIIIMNKEEAQDYTKQDTDDISNLLDGLLALGPKLAVITDGPKGSYAARLGEQWFLGTRPEIPRVEVTGAGDAYATAFAAAIFHGENLPVAMQWGTLNAEGVIQQIGPHAGLKTREQLMSEVAHLENLQPQKIK